MAGHDAAGPRGGVLAFESRRAPVFLERSEISGAAVNLREKKIADAIKIIVDKQVLKSYYEINIDSIPGGESPPCRPSECRPRVTQLGAFFRSRLFSETSPLCTAGYQQARTISSAL